ncbi:MAG: hypothetical protein SFV24_08145 [Gemmatimonadales bacterium]|nr:hypothetical protein [Gemmatimonadales bacterium]
MLKPISLLLALAFLAVGATPGSAQSSPRSWSLAVGAGPFRIDDLAGTPLVPTAQLLKAGRRAAFGVAATWVNNAGFYTLTALTLDVGVGVRSGGARNEVFALVGPTAIVGGDSDGTPYTSAGAHLTLGGTRWLTDRVGITAGAVGRVWFTTANSQVAPSASIGLRFRL